ncbi:unnamed protein product, partial [Prorocentrum cordatum]
FKLGPTLEAKLLSFTRDGARAGKGAWMTNQDEEKDYWEMLDDWRRLHHARPRRELFDPTTGRTLPVDLKKRGDHRTARCNFRDQRDAWVEHFCEHEWNDCQENISTHDYWSGHLDFYLASATGQSQDCRGAALRDGGRA